MPRPLVLGNGRLFIGIAEDYTIRDLYWPQVGLYNHLSGHPIRMGVWMNGRLSWCGDDGWSRSLRYRNGTRLAECTLENPHLGVRLSTEESVAEDADLYVRRVRIENLTENDAECRLFFSHDLRLAETDIGDTAFYWPAADGIVHYKGPHWLLFGGASHEGGLFEYTTGIKAFAGLEGTWRDAEDGHLEMHPIAQGSVDSTFSLRLFVSARASAEADYWIVCAQDMPGLLEGYHEGLVDRGVQAHLEAPHRQSDHGPKARETHRQSHHGPEARETHRQPHHGPEARDTHRQPHPGPEARGTHRQDADATGLSPRALDVLRQCLPIISAHVDQSGAILAALDSDIMQTNRANYAYCWPRDGALIAEVLDDLGRHDLSAAFFRYGLSILRQAEPKAFLQKYRADGALGASWHPWILDGQPQVPLQEDETASFLSALCRHLALGSSAVSSNLQEEAGPMLEALARFLLHHRDLATGLPLPSYDLWEERHGVHTYTVCTVIRALRDVAPMLGQNLRTQCDEAADRMRAAMLERLVDPEPGCLLRCLKSDRGQLLPDATVDASTLHVALLGILPPDHPDMLATGRLIEDRLWVRSEIGGLARYEGDYYFRGSDRHPGNPWIIATLWLAQYRLLSGDRERGLDLIEWAARQATESWVLPEQIDPNTGQHLSVSPLPWSHAEYVKTCRMAAQL